MSWAAAAVVGGSIVAGSMQADAAGDAASAQSEATTAANAEQAREFNLGRGDMAPYRTIGGQAANRIGDVLGLASSGWKDQMRRTYADVFARNPGFNQDVLRTLNQTIDSAKDPNEVIQFAGTQGVSTPGVEQIFTSYQQNPSGAPAADSGSLNKQFTVADFWKDPVTELGLQFGLNEGTKGINRIASASGMRNSGQTLKALTQYGQDYMGTKAGESENRFYGDQDRIFNRLAGVAGTGQTAATNTANLGVQTAGNIGSNLTAMGNARGAASIARGNAYGNAANTIGNYWNQQSTLNRIFPRGGSGGGQSNAQLAAMYNF